MIEENEMMVFLTDPTVTAELYTTEEVIALNTGNTLDSVKRLIRNHRADLEEFGVLGFEIRKPTTTGSVGGRPKKVYMLNQQQATFFITLLDNTEQTVAFKKELVKQFFAMAQELAKRNVGYENGKYYSKSLDKAIQDRYGEDVKFYVYSNYANLANKTVLGKNAKQIREEHNVSKDVSVTQLITPEQQEELENVKDRIATLISMNLDYYAIKAIVTGNGVKELNAKYSKKKKTA